MALGWGGQHVAWRRGCPLLMVWRCCTVACQQGFYVMLWARNVCCEKHLVSILISVLKIL